MTTAGMTQLGEAIYRYRGLGILISVIFVVVLWVLRLRAAQKNMIYTSTLRKKYAVLVVASAYEDPDTFEQCLASIREHGQPTQLLVSVNDAAHADPALSDIAHEYATTVIEQSGSLGYREQLALLAQKVRRVAIVLVTDPTTTWTASTANVLQPFADEKMGFVSGKLLYERHSTQIWQRVGRWMLDIQQGLILPFQSFYEQAYGVMHHTTYAVRLKPLLQALDDMQALPVAASHSSSMSLWMIQQGYNAHYQSSACSVLNYAISLQSIVDHYTEISRAAYWQLICRLRAVWGLRWLVRLAHLGFCMIGFVYVGIIIVLLGALAQGWNTLLAVCGLSQYTGWSAVVVCGVFVVWLGWQIVRNMPHIRRRPRDVWFLPVYLVAAGGVALASKLWAIASVSRQHELDGVRPVWRYTATALAVLIVFVTIPLVYLVAIVPSWRPTVEVDHVPASRQNTAKRTGLATKTKERRQNVTATTPQNTSKSHPQQAAKSASGGQMPMTMTVAAQEGDSQSLLARRYITDDRQLRELTAAQRAYIENRLVAAMGQRDEIAVGETFTVSADTVRSVVAEAKALDAGAQARWSEYAADGDK